jgi:tRNA (guanine-N7-)-methyltransferase
MQYIKVKNANKIVSSSSYLISNPANYKNKWKELFGNNNPICLELGMGRGSFIVGMAKAHPNINYIGIEINESQMVEAVKKLESTNIKNVKLINADAKDIADFFGKEIDTIYLTFSEPWPKKQDEKRRFTHAVYLRIYDRIFKKKKHIIFKSDNKGLFAHSLESLSQYWYSFERVSLDLHHDEDPIENVMTDFEKEYEKEGRPIYYIDAIYED